MITKDDIEQVRTCIALESSGLMVRTIYSRLPELHPLMIDAILTKLLYEEKIKAVAFKREQKPDLCIYVAIETINDEESSNNNPG